MATTFTQTAFRFRNDDGNETAATWAAALNTNYSVDVTSGNANIRLRLAAQETGTTAATYAGQLYYSINGAAYAAIGSASSKVKAIASSNFADDAATTQQISSFTFVAGKMDEVDGTTTATGSIAQNSGTEFEFSLQFVAADFSSGVTTIDFRLYRSSAAIAAYTYTARAVVTKSLFAAMQFYDGTAWQDITSDAQMGTLRWNGGILGGGPTDRVAVPGTLEVELDNSIGNTGGLLGYYSPDHANRRTGWAIGAKIRVKLVSGGNAHYDLYRITGIKPVAGKYRSRRVEVTAKDYMEEFAKRKVSGLDIQTEKTGDQLITTLVASLPFAPTATDYDTGTFSMPYSFHEERDEDTYCLTVLQKIAQSDFGMVYRKGDATGGETLCYENPKTRQATTTSAGTLNDTMTSLEIQHAAENIWNKVRVTTTPVSIGTTIEVLGQIPEEFGLEPGETRTVFIRYVDDITARRISGILDLNPSGAPITADTDYKMSSVLGDGGNDLNGNLTITPTAGANSLMLVLNNSAAVKGFVNLLQVRGYKVTTYNDVESVNSDSTSITAYGERTITYNMPYQSNTTVGDAVGAELLRRFKDPASTISGVTFIANSSTTLMGYALTLGIGSRITITETATGVNTGFFINGFEYELLPGNILQATWILERAFAYAANYWILQDASYGQLGTTTILAPI